MVETKYSTGVTRGQAGATWSAFSAMGAGRERNADAFAVKEVGPVSAFAIGDGVGSLPASPLVSTAVVEAAVNALTSTGDHSQFATNLLAEINIAASAALERSDAKGASTIACIRVGSDSVWISTAGDSGVLSVESDGTATMLTEPDHVPNQPNILLAWIDGDVEVVPHVVVLDHMPFRLCLATDGVTGALDLSEIARILTDTNLSESARAVVVAAQAAGAQDDVTVIVIGWERSP